MLSTSIARLRLIGLIESLSWFALLFIAVPMKRMPGLSAWRRAMTLVTIIGPIHGGLWCLYIPGDLPRREKARPAQAGRLVGPDLHVPAIPDPAADP